MTTRTSSSRAASQAVTEIMEQVIQLSYSVSYVEGLRPTQWAVLRYLDQSQDTARTVINYAKHNHVTKGTASQTIQGLVRRGLLTRSSVFDDRRSHRIDLTAAGRRVLKNDPITVVVSAVEQLPAKQRVQLADSLRSIFGHMLKIAGESSNQEIA